MNHTYRLAWNEQSQSYVAAPESARGKSKGGRASRGGRRLKPLALVVGSLLAGSALAAPPAANALPTGGQVMAGQAALAQNGNQLTITQGSDKAILNWQRFDIGSQAAVRFIQPATTSVALNRVLSGEASQIQGQLSANGQVYLVNPNGVIFGAGAKVDVGGLVASTLDITNEDFLAGKLRFTRNGATGAILNQGELKAGDGGLVALLAPTVKNEGIISARLGSVALAAGDKVTLEGGANGFLQVAVAPATVKTLIENKQMIVADGGQVVMTSKAADALSAGVVANSGTVQARTLQEKEGKILLLADMDHGEVQHSGVLDASAPTSGNGGFVETSAAKVSLPGNRKVTTLAARGKSGTWLIDPNDYTIGLSSGDITGRQLSADLNLGNVTIQSANGSVAGNGDIHVNAPVSWSADTTLALRAQGHVNVNADITATGQNAGLILTGKTYDYVNVYYPVFNRGAKITLSGNAATLKMGMEGAEKSFQLIRSVADLQNMSSNLSGYYALADDIDATETATWNSGKGFAPIGSSTAFFKGVFAGLGHTINKLTINRPDAAQVGLFGATNSARISDLGLISPVIAGGNTNGVWDYYSYGVGSLIGYAYSTVVTGVYSEKGTVAGGVGNSIGALLGVLNASSLTYSYAANDIKSSEAYGAINSAAIGGLVGSALGGGEIKNNYTLSKILVDWADQSVLGAILGYQGDWLALLEGRNSMTPAVVVLDNNYAYNTYQTAAGPFTSGVIGHWDSSVVPSAVNNYYPSGWYINPYDPYGSPRPQGSVISSGTASADSYPTFDFSKNWAIPPNASYPVLRKFQRDTFVFANDASKTFDGTAFSSALTASQSGATTVGTLSYSGSYQGATNAGTYTITPQGLSAPPKPVGEGIPDDLAYWQHFGTIYYVPGTLTISPRPITVKAADQSRSYGDANPVTGSLLLTSGSLVGSNSLANASVSSTATVGANAGQSFALTPSNAAFSNGLASNYAITYQDGSLAITPRPITVQANALNRYYGSANPATGFITLTGGSLVNGDTLGTASLSSPAGASAQAGQSYAVTPSNAAFSSGLASNYAITYQDGTLTVAKAPLTVTAVNAGKTYDGLAWSGAPGVSYSGFVLSEDASALSGTVTYGGNAFGAVNAGSYTITPGGLSSSNYAISYSNGALTVSPRAITVKAADQSRVYGDANPTAGALALTAGSLVGSDVLGNASVSSTAATNANAGQSFSLQPSNATFSSGLAGNYAITYQDGSLAITPRTIVLQAGNQSRTYGQANPTSGTLSLFSGNLVAGDVLGTATLSSSADANAQAGQSYALVGSNVAFSSGLASNYNIGYLNGSLTIAKAPLTVTAANAGKTYDGLAWNGTPGVSYSGFVLGENASVLGGSVAYGGSAFGAINAGSYAIAPSGLTSSNYAISYVNGALNVAKAPLTVTASNVSKAYDGLAWNGTPSVIVAGFVPGQDGSVLGGSVTFGGNAFGAVNAGSYAITPSGLSSGNYAITYVNGALTVSPRAITVKAADQSRIYGDANPTAGALTLTAGTLVGSDALGNASVSSTAATNANAGQSFALSPSNAAFSNGLAGNYAITYQDGSLAITPRPIVLQAGNQSRSYGQANPTTGFLTLSSGSLANGDTLGTASLGSSAATNAQAGQSYVLSPSNVSFSTGLASNYAITYQDGTLTVTKAPLMVTASNAAKTYDGLAWNGLPGVSYSGFVLGENASVLGGAVSYGGSAFGAINAGSYAIAPSGLSSSNYAITYVNGALNVAKAPLTVTASNASKVYDGQAWSGGNGVSYSGFVNGESQAVLGGSLGYGGNAQGAVNAGNYTLTPSGLTSGNYAISYSNGALTVSPRAITVKAADQSRIYGDANPTAGALALTAGTLAGSDVLGNASVSSAATANANAGQSFALTPSNAAFSSGLAGNYAITYQDGALTITPRSIVLQAGNQSRSYGQANPTTGFLTLSSGSLVNGDTLGTASLSSSAPLNAQAGQSYQLVGSNVAFSSGQASNYAITYQDGTLTVTKAPLLVTASNAAKTYDGLAWNGLSGVSYSGFVLGENASVLGGALTYGGNAFGAVNAGSYAIAPSGLTSSNYAITYVNGALNVAKAPLTVTASNASKVYDGQVWSGPSGLSALQFAGFVNGENSSVLSGQPSYSGNAQGAVDVGTYAFAPAGLSSQNYAMTYHGGQLSITPRSLVVKAADRSRSYGAANPLAGQVVVAGGSLAQGDSLGEAHLSSAAEVTAGAGRQFALTPSSVAFAQGKADNYAITYQDGTLSITKALLTVTALDGRGWVGSRPWQGGMGVSFAGFLNGDDANDLSGSLSYGGSSQGARKAGSYVLTPSGFASDNYDIAYVDGSLTLRNPPAVASASNTAVPGGGQLHRVTREEDKGPSLPQLPVVPAIPQFAQAPMSLIPYLAVGRDFIALPR